MKLKLALLSLSILVGGFLHQGIALKTKWCVPISV